MPRTLPALFAVALLAPPAAAQEALRFRWQPGQTHAYAVRHTTTITETAPVRESGKPVTTTTTVKLAVTRTWTVTAVDAAGVGTLDLAITALRQEITKPAFGPDGTVTAETLVRDSADPKDAAELVAVLNKPILTAKVDPLGNVVEAKTPGGDESAAARLRAELPFRVRLPERPVAVSGAWDRAFAIRIDPPAGTGESYDAKQTYTFKGLNGPHAAIGVTTALANPPAATADLQPLLPWLWEGDVFVNTKTGGYAGAKLAVKKEIANHAGAGTKFVFESEYTEAAVGGK